MRFGNTKGKVWFKKGDFRGDLGGGLVWESATPSTHIWERFPPQKAFFKTFPIVMMKSSQKYPPPFCSRKVKSDAYKRFKVAEMQSQYKIVCEMLRSLDSA